MRRRDAWRCIGPAVDALPTLVLAFGRVRIAPGFSTGCITGASSYLARARNFGESPAREALDSAVHAAYVIVTVIDN